MLLEDDMRKAASYLEDKLFIEYWGEEAVKKIDIHNPSARIKYWLEQADFYAKEWTPSEFLFLDTK